MSHKALCLIQTDGTNYSMIFSTNKGHHEYLRVNYIRPSALSNINAVELLEKQLFSS